MTRCHDCKALKEATTTTAWMTASDLPIQYGSYTTTTRLTIKHGHARFAQRNTLFAPNKDM